MKDHILSLIAFTFRENRECVFIIIVQYMLSANCRIRFALQIILVCLYSAPSHFHHCWNISGNIELTKCQIYFVEWVSKITHILSVIYIQYVGFYVFSLPITLAMMREYIYIILSYYHHQIGSISHYPLFKLGHETMVCAVCRSIFLYHTIKLMSWSPGHRQCVKY